MADMPLLLNNLGFQQNFCDLTEKHNVLCQSVKPNTNVIVDNDTMMYLTN